MTPGRLSNFLGLTSSSISLEGPLDPTHGAVVKECVKNLCVSVLSSMFYECQFQGVSLLMTRLEVIILTLIMKLSVTA